MDERFRAVATLAEALTVLEQAIAAKYTMPEGGIPSSDMDASVQSALALALTSVQSLADYYTKTQVDSIAAAIAATVNATSGEVVASLPTASASTLGKIYYVGPTSGEYDRYVTNYDGTTYSWLQIGTTDVDMTQYATVDELNQLDKKVDDINGEVKPISQRTQENWWLNTSQIQSRNDCKCVVLPVNGGENVKLVIGATTAYYYVTTAIPTPNSTPSWATGYSARSQMVAAESPQQFTLPSDARFIILSTNWFGADNTPSKVIIGDVDYVQGSDGISKRVDDLTAEMTTKATMSRIAENTVNAMYGNGFAKSTNPDGSAHFVSQANITGYKGVSLGVSETPKANTDYFLIVDINVTADILASDGMGCFVLKLVGGGNFNSTFYKVGTRSVVWAKVSAASPTGAFIQLRDTPPGTWPEGAVTFDIYHCALVEAKDYAAEDMVAALVELGWPTTMDGVPVSDYAIRQVHFPAIDAWGDSLSGATFGYTQRLAQISGLTVNMYSYGGKTSQYIRAQFDANFNPDNFQIFWVGRNNYTQPESILDDLKAMVGKLSKPNYMIIMPPNGGYGYFNGGLGELKGGTSYEYFMEIERLLSSAFGHHFVNLRRAAIERWSQGVVLLSSFTQPAVGGTVQIEVSDANALTTYNTFDTEYQGETFMKKIAIGINGQYDIYTVLSKVDDTHLSVSLDESQRVAPGGTVGNVEETDYTLMLRVEQYADYMFRAYDSTLSTYRTDGVHPSSGGRMLNAQIIYDALRLFM